MPTSATTETLARPTAALTARLAAAFVWGVWGLMFLTALAFVWYYGSRDIPMSDEWSLLLDVEESVSVRWLWAQYAEHRVPLAKLLWVGVLWLTDHDFRFGNFLSVAALAAAAAALILAARSQRGRTRFADAFFPLALLSLGQGLNFLMWWQMNQMLAPVVALALLVLIVRAGAEPGPRQAILAAACLVLLSLCGPGGLPYALALAPWLGFWAVRHGSSAAPYARRDSLLVLGLTATAVALVGGYFIGLQRHELWPDKPDARATLSAILQVFSLGLGTATRPYWAVAGSGVVAVLLVSATILAAAWLRRPGERFRACGLLAFLAAAGSLALVIGRMRAGMGIDYVMLGTYVTLMTPALCGAYFAWDLYAAPALRPLLPLGVFAAACVLLPGNVHDGLERGTSYLAGRQPLERDLRAGVPPFVLVERHLASELMVENNPQAALWVLHRLRAAGVRAFRHVPPDPAMVEVPHPVGPSTTHSMIWEDGADPAWVSGAGDGSLTFTLGKPRFVHAVRLACSYSGAPGQWAALRLVWGVSGRDGFAETAPGSAERQSLVYVSVDPEAKALKVNEEGRFAEVKRKPEKVLTIWVDEVIDWFRIYPDYHPCSFRLRDLALLVPSEGQPPATWEDLAAEGAIILDNNRPGYTEKGGSWYPYEGPAPIYGGGLRVALRGAKVGKACWEVVGVPAGSYAVQATWTAGPDRTGAARYRLYDGDQLVASPRADQRQSPTGPQADEAPFQELATVAVASGRLRVELDGDADGMVIADAVRVVRLP